MNCADNNILNKDLMTLPSKPPCRLSHCHGDNGSIGILINALLVALQLQLLQKQAALIVMNHQQQQNGPGRQTIWTGTLEWIEKPKPLNEIPEITRNVPCIVVANLINGEPELKAETWPEKLLMQVIPKHFLGNIGGAHLKESKCVLFQPTPCEAFESLIKYLTNGYVGCVNFSGTPTSPECDIKLLILIYSPFRKSFTGFIPNDQPAFLTRLRYLVKLRKRSLILSCQKERLAQNSLHKCHNYLLDQLKIDDPQNNSSEDLPTPKVNKDSLMESNHDEPTISNSLPTVDKELQNNTSSLAKSDFHDMSASNVDCKKAKYSVAKQDLSKLIEVIETYVPLWNFKLLPEERSDAIKTNLWNNVYVHFNEKYSIPELQISWNYLKEKYTRKKNIALSGSAAIKKEWPHLHSLTFLDVVLSKKRTTGSIPSTSKELNLEEPPRQKKKLLIEDHMSVPINELKNSMLVSPTPSEPEQFNEDKCFYSYLASLMVGMPRNAKLRLQSKLINLVIEQI